LVFILQPGQSQNLLDFYSLFWFWLGLVGW